MFENGISVAITAVPISAAPRTKQPIKLDTRKQSGPWSSAKAFFTHVCLGVDKTDCSLCGASATTMPTPWLGFAKLDAM